MPSFFSTTGLSDDFINTLYALNIEIENYFSTQIFDGDTSRIIYSSDAHAFRKRAAQDDKYGNLNLPFLNYYVTNISQETDRKLWNNEVNLEGIYVPEVGEKIRVVPVRIEYEATIFLQRFDDTIASLAYFLNDASNETILNPTVEVNNYDLNYRAILDYKFDFNTEYNENDWLEKNEIHSIGLDFSFDTVFLYTNLGVSITEEVIFNFLSAKEGYEDLTDPDNLEYKELLVTYFEG